MSSGYSSKALIAWDRSLRHLHTREVVFALLFSRLAQHDRWPQGPSLLPPLRQHHHHHQQRQQMLALLYCGVVGSCTHDRYMHALMV